MLGLRFLMIAALPLVLGSAAAAQGYSPAGYDDEVPAAIALFRYADYGGEVREVFDPFSTIEDISFNDRAGSVAVLAGQWELCEHKDFTGRCVFIREDVPDLAWFGLDRRVTSVRPIFEYTEAQHGLMFTRDGYGNIRYAHDSYYGNDTYQYGYASSSRITVYHYGFSPLYARYGYYSPSWGYDPYGFAYGPRGHIRYTGKVYRHHPRPVAHPINTYWKGRDWRDHPRRSEWRGDRRDDRRDDHRDDRRDDRWDGRTPDARDVSQGVRRDNRGDGRRDSSDQRMTDRLPVAPDRGAGRPGRDGVSSGTGRAAPASPQPFGGRDMEWRQPDPIVRAEPAPPRDRPARDGARRSDRPGDEGLAGGPAGSESGYRRGRESRTGDSQPRGGGGEGSRAFRTVAPPDAPVFSPPPPSAAASAPPQPVFSPPPARERAPQMDRRPRGSDDGGSRRGGRREGSAQD